uniref:Reverse transcriptase N-terminal domain-containing protein n=1 Tax=Gelidium vagum TaxID=35171 RepID=A0A141SE02_GELVA|nr:hypothetical protein Gvag_060 [Gelidium vagum]AMK96520.1 hypothetical protein Gvag_060 [Gelidium vagum]
MFSYHLKSYKSWKSLPWKQINERIFILQNKIYRASQECNQKDLKHNQSILINSLEAKFKCIEDVDQFIYRYYLKYNSETYSSTEFFKRDILICLLRKEQSNCCITDKVKQNILYLCIQPEWQAKLEPRISKYFTNFIPKTLDSIISKHSSNNLCYIFSITSYIKYININNLLAKVQSSLQIDSTFKIWMKEQRIVEPLKYNCSNQYTTSNYYDDLYRAIKCIIYCGIEWFTLTKVFHRAKEYNKLRIFNMYFTDISKLNIIYTAEKKHVFDDCLFFFKSINLILNLAKANLKYAQYRYETKNCVLKSYVKMIKMSIYKKDFLGRLRPNTKLNIIKSINKIQRSFTLFYKEYKICFSDTDFIKLCRVIDNILNNWLRKKYKGQKKIWCTANLIKHCR